MLKTWPKRALNNWLNKKVNESKLFIPEIIEIKLTLLLMMKLFTQRIMKLKRNSKIKQEELCVNQMNNNHVVSQ